MEGITKSENLLADVFSLQSEDQLTSVAHLWRCAFEDWPRTPHGLAQDYELEGAAAAAACALIAGTVILFSDVNIAARTIGLKGILGSDRWPETIAVPVGGRMVSEKIAELTTTAEDAKQFMALTLIRFHLEQRIEQITEVFASVSSEFPLQAVRLQLLTQPEYWTEQRFDVDTSRIITLLMGKELYGDKSIDVWFRELLQNAIDACAARQRVEPDSGNAEIEIESHPSERRVSIRDNGVGMSRWHLLMPA